MANWNECSTDDDDEFIGPPTSLRHRIPRVPSTLVPDTPEHVASQTSDVFKNFLYQSYRQDQIRLEYDATPRVTAFDSLSTEPQSPTFEIGRQLAVIGDDINKQYADVFADMIRKLSLTPDTAYEAFEGVAKKLFENEMNWGRILILLCFGYRMAMSILKNNFHQFTSFLGRITKYVVRFFVSHRIANWIAECGGWNAAMSFVPTISRGQFVFITGMACLSVLAVYFLNNK